MVVTQDADLEQKIRMYGLHGISKTAVERYKTGLPFYDIVYPGYKANLTDIQAALGVVQIQKLEQITHKRNRAAAWYDECLSGVEEIVTPIIRESNYSARHLYPILLNQKLKPHRDDIILRLRSHGIYSSVHFIPIYFHTFFKNFLKEIPSLPVTEDHFYREISLPLFPALKKGEVKYVCEVLKGIIVGLK